MYGLQPFIFDMIWVCDGGSNLLKALEKCVVVRCMAHRLNNCLQVIFFQTEMNKVNKQALFPDDFDDKSDDESDHECDTDSNQSEDSSEEQTNGTEKRSIAITSTSKRQTRKSIVTIISQLPLEARRILVTIIDCKELVKYVKKVILQICNRLSQ